MAQFKATFTSPRTGKVTKVMVVEDISTTGARETASTFQNIYGRVAKVEPVKA